MATLREYFDNDFGSAAKVYVKLQGADLANVDVAILYDFSALQGFIACYVRGALHTLDYFRRLLDAMQHGQSQVTLAGTVGLPSARTFPGRLQIRNDNPFEIRAQFHGDPEWISTSDIMISGRIFIYSETQLNDTDVLSLKQKGSELGQKIQFRSTNHAIARSASEKPLAFISHDSRDKDLIAKAIALGLQRLMCPVWYDEFSLKVGDNLRDSIEGGLKSCRKCILVLSPSFLTNRGWTKKEFDSVFTREILEDQRIVLPVWYNVSKEQIFNYSPSLLNVKGIDWNRLGETEVCRQLANAVFGHDKSF